MKKGLLVASLIACVLAGYAVGFLVRWPGHGGGSTDSVPALAQPLKGPADALVNIVEISEFQ
jgi:hypothetical protein